MEGAPRASRRSESSRRAILTAALDLLHEQGFQGVTIEGIAGRAGVGKQTIYRWWPSKGAVAFEALLDALRVDLSFEDTGDLRADLTTQVATLARIFTSRDGHHLAALIGGAQADRDLARAMLDNWLLPRRDVARDFLRRGRERGQLRDDVDIEVAIDVIWAGLYYRLLLPYAPLDEEYAAEIVDAVLRGLAAPALEEQDRAEPPPAASRPSRGS